MNADAPRIFYAEDNPGDVLLVRSALREIGHLAEIDTAKDGDQAMEWLRLLASSSGIEPPRLILLDLNLPRTSGLDLLSFIRSQPALRRIPTVVLTSSEAPRDRARCAELGGTDYFVKPSLYDGYVSLARLLEPLLVRAAG